MITTSYDLIAEQFNADRRCLGSQEEKYLRLLIDPLPAGCTALDLGCGTGHPIANYVADRGHHVVGVDDSESMLVIARQRLPKHRWIHDLMEQIEFDETFAAVVCWDSLFHLPRRFHQPIMTKIHRWLVPGGRVMVSSGASADPADDGPGFTGTMFGHEFYYDSLSPERMVAMIEVTGFEIVLAEMCDQPAGIRSKGKWATVAAKKSG